MIQLIQIRHPATFPFFFFNDTATTEIYTLSLHDALPICRTVRRLPGARIPWAGILKFCNIPSLRRSEEHTSELQSHLNLVCRLLLEKKKNYSSFVLRHNVRSLSRYMVITFLSSPDAVHSK